MSDLSGFASLRTALSRIAKSMSPTRQLTITVLIGSILSLAVALLLVGFEPGPLGLSLLGYVIAAALSVNSIRKDFPHSLLGSGNLVTVARMAMVFALLAPLLSYASPLVFVVIAVLILILDGFDGFLARKEERTSSFGARFDMEIDSALGLILAVNVVISGNLGAWILLLGLPRYLFIVAAKLWTWLNRPLPNRLSRKVVAMVQMGTLIGLNSALFPIWFELLAAIAMASALIWSFGRDVLWSWRAGQ